MKESELLRIGSKEWNALRSDRLRKVKKQIESLCSKYQISLAFSFKEDGAFPPVYSYNRGKWSVDT